MLNIFRQDIGLFRFFKPIVLHTWVAAGMAAVSTVASIESSKASNKQTKANAESSAKFLLQNFNVTKNNLQLTADELNKQVGMELTQLKFDALKVQATTSNTIVEKNIAGATAARLYDASDIKEVQFSNQLKQKAESNMVDIQNKLMTAKYNYESGTMNNAVNMMNNTQSTIQIGAGAIGAGVQGYTLGKGLR